MNERIRIAALAGTILVATTGVSFAQTETPATAPATTVAADNDDGFDLGWLGLIGLLGLAGLARRREPVHRTTATTAGTTRL